MSSISDTVRERVAVAIAGIDQLDFDENLHEKTRKAYLDMAEAALSAIGYDEIVGALAAMLVEFEIQESDGDLSPLFDQVRAALRKARGETNA